MSFAMDYPELEKLYEQVGGKFRLTVLLQRRVNELVKGAPRLIKVDHTREKDFIHIALEEVKSGKINLSEDAEQVVHAESDE